MDDNGNGGIVYIFKNEAKPGYVKLEGQVMSLTRSDGIFEKQRGVGESVAGTDYWACMEQLFGIYATMQKSLTANDSCMMRPTAHRKATAGPSTPLRFAQHDSQVRVEVRLGSCPL